MQRLHLGLALGLSLVACAKTPAVPGLQTRTAALEAGAEAPTLSLRAHDGTTVELGALHQAGPAVVVFYRGHW